MKFGMPTLLELPSMEANIALASRLGLDFIELNMCLPSYQQDRLEPETLNRMSDKYGFSYTVHLEEAFDPCVFNPVIAQAWLEVLRRLIAKAKEFHCPILNMHLATGTYFTLPDERQYLYENYQTHYTERLLRFRDACDAWIGSSDIRICIENTDGFSPFKQQGIESLLESPAFALTWDIGHSHSTDDTDVPFLFSHQDRIKHFHLHDAIGKKHHLALGTGEIDLTETISFMRNLEQRNGPIRTVVETNTAQALETSVAWLSDNANRPIPQTDTAPSPQGNATRHDATT